IHAAAVADRHRRSSYRAPPPPAPPPSIRRVSPPVAPPIHSSSAACSPGPSRPIAPTLPPSAPPPSIRRVSLPAAPPPPSIHRRSPSHASASQGRTLIAARHPADWGPNADPASTPQQSTEGRC
ncbi:Os05g0566700, partial [Oryza sativa Japonica Group]